MTIKKILFPTDLSDNAAKALPYVKSLAQKYGAEIILLYVATDFTHLEPWYGELEAGHARHLQEREMKLAEKRLEEVCRTDLEGCPLFRRLVKAGDPTREVLGAVESEGADLVVMVTRGRGLEKDDHLALGAVSLRVINDSPVPVLTINPAKAKP